MEILKTSRAFGTEDRWALGLFAVAFVYVFACDYAGSIGNAFPAICPWRAVGIHCPGCGMTRACGRLLHGDITTAVRLNPLILFVAPYVLYRFAEMLAAAMTGRALVSGWPTWFVRAYPLAFLVTWGILAIVRIVGWIVPSFTPLQFGLPAAL